MILVDSNVIFDVASSDPASRDWSKTELCKAANSDEIAINPIICAEVSAGFPAIESLDSHLGQKMFHRLTLPYEAGFIAGRAFIDYRRRRGGRTSPLPDFYIGAHAAVASLTLLTRDLRRYASYFPKVRLNSPN